VKLSESPMTEPQTPVYEFGTFRVDAARHLLLDRDSQAVPLTPKVFDTLVYLITHRNQVQKKEEMIRAIWPGRVVEENNLSQNISTLRRILGESRDGHQYIVTVPGIGYRWVARVSNDSSVTGVNPAPEISSIAVLPFLPLVAEHRDLSLELGMADTLIARLSGIRQVIVRPIGSVRKYVEVDQDSLQAGRELGVESVLEGSIQRWGDAIRVTVRLMNVASGAAQWADTFDEKFSDIFSVQDAIAKRVAAALVPQLGQEEKQNLVRRQTENAEVYELYLKGRFHLFRLTPPEIQTAVGYFQRAVAIEPAYAPAHLGLASAMFRLPLAGELRSTEFYPKAKEAARMALEIDDQIAEVHALLGWISFWYDWDWKAAENHFRKAQLLDPNNGESHLGYAHLLSNTGRHQEALSEAMRARELDPLFMLANALESQFLLHAGQADEAMSKLHQTLALDANFWLTHLYFSSVYFEMGRYTEALVSAEQATSLSGGSSHAKAVAACALTRLGRQEEARALLDDLLLRSTQRYVPPYHFALLYNGLGETDHALVSLERGVEQKDPRMTFLKVEPKLQNLRSNPAFTDIMRRVGF
jgi:serine/threonine-protein kinase